ncbi:MAG: hypothetical protein R3348_07480 [Xanthomonadales bacterium]|nr:hypothetical protein [Xanthomonadales bacterium]
MIFYVALLLVCVAVSFVLVWLYRSLSEVGKAAYRALLPSRKDNRRREDNLVRHVSLNATPSPWGWSKGDSHHHAIPEVQGRRPQSPGETPWGWPGSTHHVEKRGTGSREESTARAKESVARALTGLVDRERSETSTPARGIPDEQFDFAGRSYKVVRKPSIGKINKGGTKKPWGW